VLPVYRRWPCARRRVTRGAARGSRSNAPSAWTPSDRPEARRLGDVRPPAGRERRPLRGTPREAGREAEVAGGSAQPWAPTCSAKWSGRRRSRAAIGSSRGSSATADVSEAIVDPAPGIDGRAIHASDVGPTPPVPDPRIPARPPVGRDLRAATAPPGRQTDRLPNARDPPGVARVSAGVRRSVGRPALSRRSVRRSRSRSARPAEARDRSGSATSTTAR
jgi:hypothetical protein